MKVVFHEDRMYFLEPAFHGEYQKEIQTLDYDDNQDVVNLDLSGITLHYSGDDTQTGQNQEMGELDTSGMTLDQSGDEHPIIEEVSLSLAQIETQILENIASPPSGVPHQSLAEDVLETHKRQFTQRHTRGISKPTYESELSSKVKYPMSHYVSNHCLS